MRRKYESEEDYIDRVRAEHYELAGGTDDSYYHPAKKVSKMDRHEFVVKLNEDPLFFDWYFDSNIPTFEEYMSHTLAK